MTPPHCLPSLPRLGLSTFNSIKALGKQVSYDTVMQVNFQYFFYSITTAYRSLLSP